MNNGKLENVSSPTATVESWIAWKNATQCIANSTPETASHRHGSSHLGIVIAEDQDHQPQRAEAKTARPKTIITGEDPRLAEQPRQSHQQNRRMDFENPFAAESISSLCDRMWTRTAR